MKIRVEPNSIRTYGNRATETFAQIRSDLEGLVDGAATVHYFGPNATKFKKDCAQLCVDFSTNLLKDIQLIADAVKVSTSNIAGSLGGSPINITVNGSAVVIPPISSDDSFFDLDWVALTLLSATSKARFTSIEGGLDTHLASLRSTDWTGNAKDGTVEAVTRFTNSAKSKCTEAAKSIADFIEKQVESTKAADQ